MVMQVVRYNYPSQFTDMDALVDDLAEMIRTGRYILTDEVRKFETAFAAAIGAGHAVGTNTGTDALIVSMMALDIGRGHRVVTQANTFDATVAAIRLAGATPVPPHAQPETFPT